MEKEGLGRIPDILNAATATMNDRYPTAQAKAGDS
jgi:hypothetical protein